MVTTMLLIAGSSIVLQNNSPSSCLIRGMSSCNGIFKKLTISCCSSEMYSCHKSKVTWKSLHFLLGVMQISIISCMWQVFGKLLWTLFFLKGRLHINDPVLFRRIFLLMLTCHKREFGIFMMKGLAVFVFLQQNQSHLALERPTGQ